MSYLSFNVGASPGTPASTKASTFVGTDKKLKLINDAGVIASIGEMCNASTANQTGFASDTYLAGSSIAIPVSGMKVSTTYRLRFDMAKTAAGTATPAIAIRFGTAGTTGDTARLTFTFAAGTAASDTALFEVCLNFRVVGVSAVAAGYAICCHHLAATGMVSTGASGNGIILVTSGAFDSTVANSIIGASFNGGASFSGTNTVVQAQLSNA